MRSLIFSIYNPSIRTMPLGFTKPPTEMSTKRTFWDKTWQVRKADNVTAIRELIVYTMWDTRRLTTL
jgi:hypothetical protein